MLKKVLKKELSPRELETADKQLADNIDLTVSQYGGGEIAEAVGLIKEVLGKSTLDGKLQSYISYESACARELIDEDNLQDYVKYYEIAKRLGYDAADLALSLGDFYNRAGDGERALRHYKETFTRGFDLCRYGYSRSLSEYAEMIGADAVKELKMLIQTSPRSEDYCIDFSNTYLLLLSMMEQKSTEYLEFLNEAIDVTRPLARENRSRDVLSDSDEERNLCELLSLKLEYYVDRRDCQMAKAAYDELTDEIARSGCVRYYHARDEIYNNMI